MHLSAPFLSFINSTRPKKMKQNISPCTQIEYQVLEEQKTPIDMNFHTHLPGKPLTPM